MAGRGEKTLTVLRAGAFMFEISSFVSNLREKASLAFCFYLSIAAMRRRKTQTETQRHHAMMGTAG